MVAGLFAKRFRQESVSPPWSRREGRDPQKERMILMDMQPQLGFPERWAKNKALHKNHRFLFWLPWICLGVGALLILPAIPLLTFLGQLVAVSYILAVAVDTWLIKRQKNVAITEAVIWVICEAAVIVRWLA